MTRIYHLEEAIYLVFVRTKFSILPNKILKSSSQNSQFVLSQPSHELVNYPVAANILLRSVAESRLKQTVNIFLILHHSLLFSFILFYSPLLLFILFYSSFECKSTNNS